MRSPGWARLSNRTAPQGTLEDTQLEAVINDYISRELVQSPALLPPAKTASLLKARVYLRSRLGGTAAQSGRP